MTTSYFPQDDEWYPADWAYEAEAYGPLDQRRPSPDVVILGAVALIILALIFGLSRLVSSAPQVTVAPAPREESAAEEAPAAPGAPLAPPATSEAFIIPYDDYILTQGPHGMSYGHFAIDIAAGKGEAIKSPINGRVSELFVDNVGNPTLVIENEAYEVTMLHGNYSIELGQRVRLGEQVGTESNQGNTRDMSGRSCRNRNCGYHTHLNVYDKRAGQNVNPLDLLPNRF